MVLKIETTLFYTYSYFFLGNKQSQPYQQGQQQFARDHSTEIVSDNSDSPTTMSIEKTEVSKNSDGKIVKTTVVISKNGSKITTITEPIIDKPVSDNSEDLKSVVCRSGTKVMPTGDVVIFPEFPTWGDFGPSIGGPGIKALL